MNTKTAFPKMPEMKLEVSESVRDSSDDESQGQEDKEIVNLISQLRGATSALNDSKKRKLAGQKIKDGMSAFNKEAKDLVAKFKRRQSTVKSEFTEKLKSLSGRLNGLSKRMDNVRAAANKLGEQRKVVDKVNNDLRAIEEDALRTKDQGLKSSHDEYQKTKLQVDHKLVELEKMVKRLQVTETKDDQITVILKSLLQDFM